MIDTSDERDDASSDPIVMSPEKHPADSNQAFARILDDAILERITDAFVALDRDWRYTYVNRRAEDLLGMSRECLLGRVVWEMVPCIVGTGLEHACRRALAEQEPANIEEFHSSTDAWFEHRVYPNAEGLTIFSCDITDRKQIELDLERGNDLLQSIFDHIPVMVILRDATGRIKFVNHAWERTMGSSLAEVEQSEIDLDGWCDDASDREQALGPSTPKADGWVDATMRTKEGRAVETRWITIPLSDGTSILIGQDITERRRAEEEARRSESLHAALVRSINVILWDADAETFRFSFVSPQAERLLGYSVDQWVSEPDFWRAHTHPDDVERCVHECRTAMAHGDDHEIEYRMIAADGRVVWLHDVVSVTTDATGKTRLRGVMIDVSERKRAEEALRKSELRFQIIAHATNDAVWDWNLTTDAMWWNEGLTTLFGYEPGQVGRKSDWWRDRIHTEDRDDVLRALDEALASDTTAWRSEYRFERADGSYAFVFDHGRIVRRADGTASRMLGALVDLTERRHMEEALRGSEARFHIAFNASPFPIGIADLATGAFIDVNEAFLSAFGYTRDEVIGQTSVGIGLWNRPADRAHIVARLESGERVRNFETTIRTKQGELRLTLISAEIIEIDGRRCILTASSDITERKLLEEQLLQAQRMEAVGRLAGGVAHDFNNLLTVISGYVDLALRRAGDDRRITEYLSEVRHAGARAAELTRQLLAFSRRQVIRPETVGLNGSVATAERMLRRLISENVDLRVELDDTELYVNFDPGQLEQVIVNLAVNARDALPGGGTITVATSRVDVADVGPADTPGLAAGPYALLTVSDNGTGMDPQTLRQIFEPFFTTKEVGRGTGLGLATVYGIVTQSGGQISVRSEPGRGSAFRVYLPRVDSAAGIAAEPSADSLRERGAGTILLVEDDDGVRRFARTALAAAGYTVIEAQSGPDALAACERLGGEVHLLVTDVVMPKMSGRQLAERLLDHYPRVRVLFVSGYAESILANEGVLETKLPFLEKPFTPQELIRSVGELLAGD